MKNKAHHACIIGYPNCGKSLIFNALTGLKQKVGNWPGVTVEKKTGKINCGDLSIQLTDLPGFHGLRTYDKDGCVDAQISSNFLRQQSPDLIINIIDASQLERQLYLSSQLVELGRPMIIALNMMDVAKRQHIHIDTKGLAKHLGVPVVPLVARKNSGIKTLKKSIAAMIQQPTFPQWLMPYPSSIKRAKEQLLEIVPEHVLSHYTQPRFFIESILEGDVYACELADQLGLPWQTTLKQALGNNGEDDSELLIADARYQAISDCIQKVVFKKVQGVDRLTQTIDSFVLNRYLGIPIFLSLMYLMFVFAINIGGAFQDFFDILSASIFIHGVTHVLTQWHWPAWSIALLAEGLGRGINTAVTFMPVIGAMFICLSFLEDSGYMARAAGIIDRLMQKIGLSGQAFIPMIVGFGCNVPAVMGSRTLSNRRDRILSIMMMPFMSCGARLAIFAVFVSAFYPNHGAAIIFLLYLIGIATAILTARLLGRTILAGNTAPMVMELPHYHWPRPWTLLRNGLYRMRLFVWHAGKNIIWVCLLIGFLNSITPSGDLVSNNKQAKQSLLSHVGQALTPVFHPMGIKQDNWPATVGLITGILAKEVVIGTLNTLYSPSLQPQKTTINYNLLQDWRQAINSVRDNLMGLTDAIKNPLVASEADHEMNTSAYGQMHQHFHNSASAFAYLLFILLYFPCISTMAVMKRELGFRWATFSLLWSTGIAYVISVAFFQISQWPNQMFSSSLWLMALFIFSSIIIKILRKKTKRHDIGDNA